MLVNRIQIKNFLSISEAELKPGQVNQIVGGNNNGKTTVLRALETALAGSSDGSLVKRGEDAAEIIVEFDNEMKIRRRISSSGAQTVTVKKGEFSASQPQTMLNEILDGTAFNPLELLEPKKRTEALLKAIDIKINEDRLFEALKTLDTKGFDISMPPLDYTQHGLKVADQAHKYFYQRRAEANKVEKQKADFAKVKKAELPSLTEDAPELTMSDAALLEEIEANRRAINSELQKNKDVEEVKRALSEMEAIHKKLVEGQAYLKDQIAKLNTQLAVTTHQAEETQAKIQVFRLQVATKRSDDAEILKHQESIKFLTQEQFKRVKHIGKQERHKEYERIEKDWNVAAGFAKLLDDVLEALGARFKHELMAKAELPVPGLSYENGNFFLEGSSIDNLSSSKALKLAVAIARKLSGKTKLICIDGAELLDEASYAELRKEIESDGFIYFITKVGQAFPDSRDKVFEMSQGKVTEASV